jgi:hypothetical protein
MDVQLLEASTHKAYIHFPFDSLSPPLLSSVVLTHVHTGQFPGGHEHMGLMLIYVHVCGIQHVFECLNTDFVGIISTINTCLILSTFIFLFLQVVI